YASAGRTSGVYSTRNSSRLLVGIFCRHSTSCVVPVSWACRHGRVRLAREQSCWMHRSLGAFLLVVCCVMAGHATASPTVLTQCGAVSSAGDYSLSGDLTCGAANFTIGANVNLDCGGRAIRFSYPGAVVVQGDNSTFINCTVDSGGASGPDVFHFYFTTQVIASNFQASNSSFESVSLFPGIGANFRNNTLHGGFNLGGYNPG